MDGRAVPGPQAVTPVALAGDPDEGQPPLPRRGEGRVRVRTEAPVWCGEFTFFYRFSFCSGKRLGARPTLAGGCRRRRLSLLKSRDSKAGALQSRVCVSGSRGQWLGQGWLGLPQ